jgi:hypothetical protein
LASRRSCASLAIDSIRLVLVLPCSCHDSSRNQSGTKRRLSRRLAGEPVAEMVQCASQNPHHQRRSLVGGWVADLIRSRRT